MAQQSGMAANIVPVALVAAYPTVRAGLRALLETQDDLRIVFEARDLHTLSLEGNVGTGVVVIDLDSGGAWGSPDDILDLPPELGLVLLGPTVGERRLVESIGDRAWAYLLKDAGSLELSRAIAAVAAGLVALQPPLARRVLSPVRDDVLPTDDSLTPRENEVLQLVAEGLPNKLIAQRLGISEHTVKFHITAILSKLDASSRTEAVRLGARRGLIVL